MFYLQFTAAATRHDGRDSEADAKGTGQDPPALQRLVRLVMSGGATVDLHALAASGLVEGGLFSIDLLYYCCHYLLWYCGIE